MMVCMSLSDQISSSHYSLIIAHRPVQLTTEGSLVWKQHLYKKNKKYLLSPLSCLSVSASCVHAYTDMLRLRVGNTVVTRSVGEFCTEVHCEVFQFLVQNFNYNCRSFIQLRERERTKRGLEERGERLHLKWHYILLQMKLPASIGQKKMKAIEQVLEELGIGQFHLFTFCLMHWREAFSFSFYFFFLWVCVFICWQKDWPNMCHEHSFPVDVSSSLQLDIHHPTAFHSSTN